ncbi:MAG TPA: metal ABC transporter permease [Kiloniellales bacterium]|nr:metal ABC transporter permease [Kiloniellales bacterium]
MLDDFLVRALLGGIGVALVAGPLGCFVVWRRMAYFGDALAHAGFLGIALGILLGFDPILGVAATGLIVATGLLLLQRRKLLASDTALGLLAHAGLALGLVLLSFLEFLRIDLLSYLFGDLLAVSQGDLALIWGGGAVVLAVLAWLWRPLLRLTLHEELAAAEGLPVFALQLAFLLLLALVVATAMKVVGILLITALLILPAAAARRLARTPEIMAIGAAAIGSLAVGGGLWASWLWDTPSGPSIVVVALLIFVVLQALPRRAGV